MNYNDKNKTNMTYSMNTPHFPFVESKVYCYGNSSFLRTFSSGSKTKSPNKEKQKKILVEGMMVDKELSKLKLYGRSSECRVSEHDVFMAGYKFKSYDPDIYSVNFIAVTFMDLLLRYVYPLLKTRKMGKAKFTPHYQMTKDKYTINVTICDAINLTYEDGSIIPQEFIFKKLYDAIISKAEDYDGYLILALGIRVYYTGEIDLLQLSSIKKIKIKCYHEQESPQLDTCLTQPITQIRYH